MTARTFWALFRKELRTYFGSRFVYFVAAAFLAYTGYYFHSDLSYFVTFGFGLNIMENFWQLLFMDIRLVLLFAIPLLTMRSFAEERRLGTLELLLSYPLRDGAIVAAKLCACLVTIAFLLSATLVYPWWVYRLQPFPLLPLIAGYLGLFLLAGACAAYGLFVSSTTDSQVLAGFLTAMPLLLLWLLSWNEAASASGTLSLVRAISMFNHFQPFAVGVVDARDVFYFGFATAVCVWATLRVLEAKAVARPPLNARAQWLRIVVAIPALVAIFGLGEALLDRRAWRLDLTSEQRSTLSPRARQILGQVDSDVRVLAFLRSQDPRNPAIEDLLRQVEASNRRIRVETLDVNRSPALAREYGVDAYGAIVVESNGQRRVFGNPSEDLLVGALLEVTRHERRVVGWVEGHGEGDITSAERRIGFSNARRALEEGFFQVRSVSLDGGDVAADVDVLAMVGPKSDPLPAELATLRHYLDRGGSVLVCLDPLRTPGLVEWLGGLGVVAGADVVVEPQGRLYGGEGITLRAQLDRGDHPLVQSLGVGPLFSRSRSVAVGPQAEGAVLLWSGPAGWATPDPASALTTTPVFVAHRDRRGPIGLGVDVLLPATPEAAARRGHLLVFGNAEFASNFFLDFLGNRDLLVNSVRWLAHDREGMGEGAPRRLPGVQQFFISEEEGASGFWVAAVIEPGIVLLIGIALAARRRWG